MKKNYKNKILGMSAAAAMLLASSAYATQIVGDEAGDPRTENVQFGYGGLNMDNITVNLFTADGSISDADFFVSDGSYTPDVMALGDFYQSDVFSTTDPALKLGFVTGKIWPISEPMGIKVVNNDVATNKYKPNNCIMATSYLGDETPTDPATTTHYLDDATPTPTLCSSYAGSSKRFQLVLNENMMTQIDQDGYGKSIDLVFNIEAGSTGDHRYQVFQKVTNRTGMRLDGMKIEVLNSAGQPQAADLNISIGLGEGDPKESGNIWEDYEIAFYPPGLWGDGSKAHLPIGWFDVNASGYLVSQIDNNSTIETGGRLDGNYVEIYGNWLPNKWVGVGMHEEIDPTIEPVLLAYWGTTPDQANDPTAEPAWYYGMYDYNEEFTNFAPVPEETVVQWATDTSGKYVIDDIEDLPNLSWNYIVNVGEAIDNNFTIRFTPKVSVDQTPPSYFEIDGVTRIEAGYSSSKGIAVITPEPTFVPGSTLTVSVADADLIGNVNVEVNVTNDSGDVETITLTERAEFPGIFSTTLPTVTDDSNVSQDGNMTVIEGTVVTVTYNDENNGTAPAISTAFTIAETPITPTTTTTTSGGGGGCTYNPDSKNFDMMFLMMMALGLLYPFRRRFIK